MIFPMGSTNHLYRPEKGDKPQKTIFQKREKRGKGEWGKASKDQRIEKLSRHLKLKEQVNKQGGKTKRRKEKREVATGGFFTEPHGEVNKSGGMEERQNITYEER